MAKNGELYETHKASDIFDHFYTKRDRSPAAYHPPKDQLKDIYDKFARIEEQLDPQILDNFEITAEFDNGRLIDVSSQYTDPNDPSQIKFGVLKDADARPIIESFQNSIKDNIASDKDFTVKVFGKNRTGIKDWHTDGENEVVGVLTLKDHDLTSQFRSAGKTFSSPKHAIAFTGDAEHKNAHQPRPTIHVIAHEAPTAE